MIETYKKLIYERDRGEVDDFFKRLVEKTKRLNTMVIHLSALENA